MIWWQMIIVGYAALTVVVMLWLLWNVRNAPLDDADHPWGQP